MINLRDLRQHPHTYRQAAADKGSDVDIDALLDLDERLRAATTRRQELVAQKNRIGKEIGQVAGRLKMADADERLSLQHEMQRLQQGPAALKLEEAELAELIARVEPQRNALWLQVPQPADPNVPRGTSADDNVEIRRWNTPTFDTAQTFEHNRGFAPKTHEELARDLNLVDYQRGVNMAGSRSYVLRGDGQRLHNAVLQFAFDHMVNTHAFTPLSVPVLVREELMVGTGFFPTGRDQAYEIAETTRGGGQDLFLTGTGEVGLMGYHAGEILDEADLPLCYTTLSTCFRREAGAAGRDAAGLYRVHQFDKVEQVVILQADEAQSRVWHQKMIGYVEEILQALELPYRLLQCCTGDLGPKNADMIDVEAWMPGRGDLDNDGRPTGGYGETHSASRLYDYQCRRLNLRYRPAGGGDEGGKPDTVFCHSLNNTVLASPRILIPLLEIHQNADGSVSVPDALKPWMGSTTHITGKI